MTASIAKGAHVKLVIDALDARKQVLAPAGAIGHVRAHLHPNGSDLVTGYAVDLEPPFNRLVTVGHFDVRPA